MNIDEIQQRGWRWRKTWIWTGLISVSYQLSSIEISIELESSPQPPPHLSVEMEFWQNVSLSAVIVTMQSEVNGWGCSDSLVICQILL